MCYIVVSIHWLAVVSSKDLTSVTTPDIVFFFFFFFGFFVIQVICIVSKLFHHTKDVILHGDIFLHFRQIRWLRLLILCKTVITIRVIRIHRSIIKHFWWVLGIHCIGNCIQIVHCLWRVFIHCVDVFRSWTFHHLRRVLGGSHFHTIVVIILKALK